MVSEQGDRTDVLDHGYIKFIEAWGSDARIVESARMSTGKGFLGWDPEVEYRCETCRYVLIHHDPVDHQVDCPNGHGRLTYKLLHHGDMKLLAYLYKHHHMTPFEMAGMTIEVQAPILVYRQWHRHRTQSYNELSARYTELPDVFYIPSVERLIQSAQVSKNKQASGGGMLHADPENLQRDIRRSCADSFGTYQWLLNSGVSPELARCVLPVNVYSRMRASANLRNWLLFLTLRMDEHAQWETRQYANVVGNIIEHRFPRTWDLFAGGRS